MTKEIKIEMKPQNENDFDMEILIKKRNKIFHIQTAFVPLGSKGSTNFPLLLQLKKINLAYDSFLPRIEIKLSIVIKENEKGKTKITSFQKLKEKEAINQAIYMGIS